MPTTSPRPERHQPRPQRQACGLQLAATACSRWPADGRPRPAPRFDVPFLVAHMPEARRRWPTKREQFEPVWCPQALERHEAGQFFMIFPTIRTLQRLACFDSAERWYWPPAP